MSGNESHNCEVSERVRISFRGLKSKTKETYDSRVFNEFVVYPK